VKVKEQPAVEPFSLQRMLHGGNVDRHPLII
jgi:hypothetical protein